MRQGFRAIAASIAALLLATALSANAAPRGVDMAAIKNFKLTDSFLHKWEAYQELAAKNPCQLSPMMAIRHSHSRPHTLDQAAETFDSQPGVHAALTQVGLSAKDTLVGMTTLMQAAMQDMMSRYPAMKKAPGMHHTPHVSAANLAFYRKHRKEIRHHQMKVGREELKHNHGHMPSCMMGSSANPG